jgi:superkiller protein 3
VRERQAKLAHPLPPILLAGVAFVGLLINFYRDADREQQARETRIAELLDDASDLLSSGSGDAGTPKYEGRIIVGARPAPSASDREALRQAKRKVDRALEIDPSNVIAQSFDSLMNESAGARTVKIAAPISGVFPRRFGSIYYSLGNAFLAQERADEAIESYRRAIEISPPHPQALIGIGNALLLQGKLEDAATTYRQALRIDPALPEAHHALAVALHREGKLDEALIQYQKAIDLKPDFAVAYEDLGDLLFGRGRMDGAIVQYRKAIDLAPGMASAYNGLGAALAARGDLEGAVASYRQALELEPGWSLAKANLDTVLHRTQGKR